MRRLLPLLVVLALLAPAAAALGQSGGGAFGPLPPAVSPSPTPSPVPKSTANQGNVSRPMLLGIAGAVAILFVGIGMYIARDARRNLTEEDRRALDRSERPKTESERKQAQRARSRSRAKTRAQKQARKKQRR